MFVFCVTVPVTSSAQISHSEQVQIKLPLLRTVDPPAPDATEKPSWRHEGISCATRNFTLMRWITITQRSAKKPNNAPLLNKVSISHLMMQRYKESRKAFEQAVRSGTENTPTRITIWAWCFTRSRGCHGAAIKQYRKAIEARQTNSSASFFSNLGAAHFSKREFEPAIMAYQHALELDPEVFERTSRGGVQAQLPSPEDPRGTVYTVAKLYARLGASELIAAILEEGDGRRVQGP